MDSTGFSIVPMVYQSNLLCQTGTCESCGVDMPALFVQVLGYFKGDPLKRMVLWVPCQSGIYARRELMGDCLVEYCSPAHVHKPMDCWQKQGRPCWSNGPVRLPSAFGVPLFRKPGPSPASNLHSLRGGHAGHGSGAFGRGQQLLPRA